MSQGARRFPLITSDRVALAERLVAALRAQGGVERDYLPIFGSKLSTVANVQSGAFDDCREALKATSLDVIVLSRVRSDERKRRTAAGTKVGATYRSRRWNWYFPVVAGILGAEGSAYSQRCFDLASKLHVPIVSCDGADPRLATLDLPPGCRPDLLEESWLRGDDQALAVNDWHGHLIQILAAVCAPMWIAVEPAIDELVELEAVARDESRQDLFYLRKAQSDVVICSPGPAAFPLISIECDGRPHLSLAQAKLDDAKDDALRSSGILAVRITPDRLGDGRPAWERSEAEGDDYAQGLSDFALAVRAMAQRALEPERLQPDVQRYMAEIVETLPAGLREDYEALDRMFPRTVATAATVGNGRDDTRDEGDHLSGRWERDLDRLNAVGPVINDFDVSPPIDLRTDIPPRSGFQVSLRRRSPRSDVRVIGVVVRTLPRVRIQGRAREAAYDQLNLVVRASIVGAAASKNAVETIAREIQEDVQRAIDDDDAVSLSRGGLNAAASRLKRMVQPFVVPGFPELGGPVRVKALRRRAARLIDLMNVSEDDKALLRMDVFGDDPASKGD